MVAYEVKLVPNLLLVNNLSSLKLDGLGPQEHATIPMVTTSRPPRFGLSYCNAIQAPELWSDCVHCHREAMLQGSPNAIRTC